MTWFHWHFAHRVERLQLEIAHRAPMWLRRWVVVDTWAKATVEPWGDTHPDTLTVSEMYRRVIR